ncbi:MAG: hypothetical protein Q4B50_00315 [Bacillota bacterium]|nr:hypothetical protein [Bacillota bacterium]
MQNLLVYSTKAYHSFSEEWLPHRDCNEFWSLYAVLRGSGFSYGFRLEIRHLQGLFDSFDEAYFALNDLEQGNFWSHRYLLPHVARSRQQDMIFDHNSFFCRDNIQMLLEDGHLALRIRGEDFFLDFSAELSAEDIWVDNGGGLRILSGPRPMSSLMCGWKPMRACFAKLKHSGKEELRLQGEACFERIWGCFPIHNAKSHWEKFCFLLHNGEILSLLDFPYAEKSYAWLISGEKGLSSFSGQKLNVEDSLEIEEWRFGCGWYLELPERPSYFLVSLQKDEFVLPVPRPVLGVYDEAGLHLGTAFAELMPGARNELNTIPLKIHHNYLKEGKPEIL